MRSPTAERAIAEIEHTLLVVDVGNTRIGAAVWDSAGLQPAARFSGDEPDEWAAALDAAGEQMLSARQRAIVIASVHGERARRFADLAERTLDAEALFVRDDLPLPMPLEIENAAEVGVDRVCSAAAAFERVGSACAVASFGTAITIDCVSDDGKFLGGAILPGIDMSCLALNEFTAGLPRITPSPPEEAYGRNTYAAINLGVVVGAAGAMREIVERYATQLGRWPTLLVTGGAAPLVLPLADYVDEHVPDLCLLGAALAWRKARGSVSAPEGS